MKDIHDMSRLDEFKKAKDALDKAMKLVKAITDRAEDEIFACCNAGEVDQRDLFTQIAARGNAARANLLDMRALAGSVDAPDIPRAKMGGS